MSGTLIGCGLAEGSAAIRSISTSVSGTSSPVVPTVVRGGGVGKNSFHTSSNPLKFIRSVKNTWAFTTFSNDVPAASNVRARFSRMKRVCFLIADP